MGIIDLLNKMFSMADWRIGVCSVFYSVRDDGVICTGRDTDNVIKI